MMAFFLVMWLINATDQETREVVATYFNPIRLAEATSDRKACAIPRNRRRASTSRSAPRRP